MNKELLVVGDFRTKREAVVVAGEKAQVPCRGALYPGKGGKMERPFAEALTYMQDVVDECRSAVTREIIVTVLAEQTCDFLGLLENGTAP